MGKGKRVIAVAQFLIFPGLLFTATAGLLTSWFDRKLTARVQMRQGPPLLQPFFDVAKLFVKETCVPAGAAVWFFLSAPLIGLAGVTLAATILFQAMWNPTVIFAGDLIVVMYLLALPSLSMILGAFASQNPLASLGGSREMKLVMAYELPFILVACVPIVAARSIRLADILAEPPVANHFSGLLALLVALIAMQARLTRVPFDIPEAECELGSGVLIEYSGPPLAMYKLTQAMMLFTGPIFLLVLYAGGIPFSDGWAAAALGGVKLLGLVTLVVLIRNTAPRLRIDQAMKLLWGPVTLAAIGSLILVYWGL